MAAKTDAEKRRERGQKDAQRNHFKSIVKARFKANGERCEGCGKVPAYHETAHLFSSAGHRVKAPYTHWPELCAELCSSKAEPLGCHERIDRYIDLKLRERLEEQAFQKFQRRIGIELPAGYEDYYPMIKINKLIELHEEIPTW